MMMTFASSMSVLFGLTLIFVSLSLLLLRGVRDGSDTYSTPARLLLVGLRLAIGWHFYVEGMEKLHTPGWSSEPYLREAVGPFAGEFQRLAGDRLRDKLTAARDQGLPAALDNEWQAYFDAFVRHYRLTPPQTARAQERLEAAKLATAKWLSNGEEDVVKIAPYPPELKVPMTMKARLAEQDRLQDRVARAEARLPSSDPDMQKQYKDAKADLNKWRAGLKRSLDAQTAKMKEALKLALIDDYTRPALAVAPSLALPVSAIAMVGLVPGDLSYVQEQWRQPKLDEPVTLPMRAWSMLQWSDAAVTWGLIVLGAGLLLGLFARLASALGAILVLSFYLAMPPLPGWPESPRLEGHYLLINKTLIEVLALGALTFIPTGRWAGVDGLLQFLIPGCCGGRQAQATTVELTRVSAERSRVAVP